MVTKPKQQRDTGDPLAVRELEKIWQPFRQDTKKCQEVFPHQDGYHDLVHGTEMLAYLIRSYAVYSMTCGALGSSRSRL